MYGTTSDTQVSNLNYTRAFIDSYRTVAVNTSCVIGVKTYSGDIYNYNKQFYIEFYANGGGLWQ